MESAATIDELFGRHYARIVRALAVAFGDAEEAADAVQDAFVEAHRRWRVVGAYSDPAGWVRKVAINRLRNGHRDRLRRRRIIKGVRPVATQDLTTELIELKLAIGRLPERMRLAVCLHHLAGCTIEEVAASLEVSPGTVKSNLHDARKRLRADMEERCDG